MTRELTQRQTEILKLIADGDSNKQIAGKLNVSPSTIKATVATICLKTGAKNRTNLVKVTGGSRK